MAGNRITIFGAGAWGTALANSSARAGRQVRLVAHSREQAAELLADHENRRALPGIKLHQGVVPTADIAEAANDADVAIAAVPAQKLRVLATSLHGLLPPAVPLIIAAKGIEEANGLLMHEVLRELLPNPAAVLSGPSFAADVGRGLPTAVTLAAADPKLAAELAALLSTPTLRLYSSTDVVGVEIGGAAKNVLAIACGIAAGRELGASAGAALIARGFAELVRFGRAYGARTETLMGLSGLGDVVLTCQTDKSRNFALGLALGRGQSIAMATLGRLSEGAATAPVLVRLARKRQVDMPIAEAVAAILAGDIDVGGAIEALLARPPRAEE